MGVKILMKKSHDKEEKPSKELVLGKKMLAKGSVFFSEEPIYISTVLGSGVAVTIWDRSFRRGGMVHFLRPGDAKSTSVAEGYRGIIELLRTMKEYGSKRSDLLAQIYGGGKKTIDKMDSKSISEYNIKHARKVLKHFHIPIISEDVGGIFGRKLIYNSFSNEMVIAKVNEIRDSDWLN